MLQLVNMSQVFFKVEILFPFFFFPLLLWKCLRDQIICSSFHSLAYADHISVILLCSFVTMFPVKWHFDVEARLYPGVTWLCLMRRLQMCYIKQHVVSSYLLVMSAVIIDYDLDLLICWGLKNGSNLMLPFIPYLPLGICLCRESFCICEVLFIRKAG